MNGIKKKKPWKRRLKKLIVLLVVLGLAVGAVRLFVWPSLQASATTTYGSYTATTGTISNAMSFFRQRQRAEQRDVHGLCGGHGARDLRFRGTGGQGRRPSHAPHRRTDA